MRLISTLFAFVFVFVCAFKTYAVEGPVGHWEGFEAKGSEKRTIYLDIADTAGKLSGSIGFPEAGALRRTLDTLTFNDGKLSAMYGAFDESQRMKFDLVLKGDEMTGTLKLKNFECDLSLKRTPLSLPYREESVPFQNGDVKLAGTLFIPNTPGPHPAIVHMHGSGDMMRKHFFFYADFFARHGIACLIFDKRGVGESTGNWHDVGFWELAEDGIAGAHALQARKDIDPRRIGMFGISQAGWIMPMAASKSKDIAFLIVVSGGPIKVEREGYWDYQFDLRKKGYSENDVAAAVDYLRANNVVTRTGEGYKEFVAKFNEAKQQPWFKELGFQMPLPPKSKGRDWYRRVMDIDHVPIVQSLDIPVLWLYGAEDESFPTAEVIPIVENIGRKGKKDFEVKMFPQADHGIRVTKEGSAFPFKVLAPGYLATMEDWLKRKAKSAK